MVAVTFRDDIFEKIINKLLTKKCEIDPLSKKYEAIINLLKFFRKNDKNLGEKIELILHKALKEKNIDLIKYFEDKIKHLNEILLSKDEVEDTYKMSRKDLEENPFSIEWNFYNMYYKKEEILIYVYEKYGQEKLDSRRANSIKKSEQMKKMMKERSENNEKMKEERRQKILDLLGDSGLFYPRGFYQADIYIENGGELNESLMLKNAKKIINTDRLIEKRKENLYEQLEMYDCMSMKKERICGSYINGNLNNLDDVIDFIRELKWLQMNTTYTSNYRRNITNEKYDSLLNKFVQVRIFNSVGKFEMHKDFLKTYSVEEFMRNKEYNTDNLGEVPILIEQRIQEVKNRREDNINLMKKLEEEREEKREEIRKKELAKKEEKKEKRREKARKARENANDKVVKNA